MKPVIAVVILSGCWGSPAPTPPQQPVSASVPMSDPVRVENTGAGPKQRLRYRLKPQSSKRIELDLAMVTEMHMDDPVIGVHDNKSEVPTMRSRMKVDVGAIDASGTAAMEFLYEDCRIAPEARVADFMRAQLDPMLAKFVGMRGRARLTARGTTEAMVFEAPPNADPMVTKSLDQMKDQMKNFYVALPDEPVGVGARWEIDQINQLMGASITTKLRYKLIALEGSTATCDVTITQDAASQTLDLGGMAGRLDSLHSSGHGRISFPLDRIVPTGTLAMETKFAFAVASGQSETIAKATIHVDIATRAVK